MKSLLFVKIGAIGDVIMAMPAVNYLQSQGINVTWMVGKSCESLVKNFTQCQVLTVEDSKLLKGNLFQKLSEIANIQMKLLGKNFDQVILAHADPRYQILTALKSQNAIRFNFGRDIHHAEAYFQLALKAHKHATAQVENYLPKPVQEWRGTTSDKIALAPGGAKNLLADDRLRRWPLEHYAGLAKALLDKGFEVHIFGAPSDAWVLEGFKDLPVHNEIGKYDLIGLLKEWSHYRFLVTHDSGPLHLGGLSQIPVYGLFGPTLSEWRFPKLNAGQGITLEKKLDCQPCYDGKRYAPCAHGNCLRQLTPQDLLAKISDNHLRI